MEVLNQVIRVKVHIKSLGHGFEYFLQDLSDEYLSMSREELQEIEDAKSLMECYGPVFALRNKIDEVYQHHQHDKDKDPTKEEVKDRLGYQHRGDARFPCFECDHFKIYCNGARH